MVLEPVKVASGIFFQPKPPPMLLSRVVSVVDSFLNRAAKTVVLTGVRRQRRVSLLRVVRVERVTGVTGRRHFVTVGGRQCMMVLVRRVQHVAIIRVRVLLCRVPIDISDHLRWPWLR